jgi:sulfite reductase (NADPH) flavoprotein alpha-component
MILLHWQVEAPQWWLPRGSRLLAASAVLLGYAGFVGAVAWSRGKRLRSQVPRPIDPGERGDWLVAFASQTGHAELLAHRTWQLLRDAGHRADLAQLGTLESTALTRYRHALFVVATTGEGDAPDTAAGFVRNSLSHAASFAGLRYGVLALGDREYAQFCGFGHRLDGWLRHAGAEPLFDLVEVDNGDAGALRHWQHHIGLLAGRTDLPDWSAPSYRTWRLKQRQLSNEGSVGGAAFHIALEPAEEADLSWQAGDIAEIGPRNSDADVAAWLATARLDADARVRSADMELALADVLQRSHLPGAEGVCGQVAQAVADALRPLPHREYSIASLPSDGSLQLLVRQMLRSDGRLGSGSGWLTAHAPLDGRIDLRIRSNPGFHPPVDDRPMVLIGNGTGIAGLRALLKARIARAQHRNWLLFGERNAAHDFHYGDEILAWQREGRIERLDLAFSRDGAGRTYVQDLLREQFSRLREWLDGGAAVYVCGSLEGMAPAVDAVLREAVGAEALEAMALDGRYRRDVY